MLITSLVFAKCGLPPYKRNISSDEFAQLNTITESGAFKYYQCVAKKGIMIAQMIKIPDLHFDMNLGVTRLDFALKDINIDDVTAGSIVPAFLDDDRIHVVANEMNFQISLQWSFLQKSYPYISDGGAGKLRMNHATGRAVVSADANFSECQNHFITKFERGEFDFGEFVIQLEGGSSWIYQSLINLVLQAVTDTLTKTLSNILIQTIEHFIMEGAVETGLGQPYDWPYLEVIKDERQVGTWRVGPGFMSTKNTGYLYHSSNFSDEFISGKEMIQYIQYVHDANDYSVAIAEVQLQNSYYIFHKYYNTYSGSLYKVMEMPKIEIKNTGALITVNITTNDNQNMIVELFGAFNVKQVEKPNFKNVSMNVSYVYTKHKFIKSSKLMNNETLQNIVEHFDKASKDTGLQVLVFPFLAPEDFVPAIDSFNRVLRLGGKTDKC